jgi:N-acetylmuramoyl-L-alanine amidase
MRWLRLPRAVRLVVVTLLCAGLFGSSWVVWARYAAPAPAARLARSSPSSQPASPAAASTPLRPGPAVDASVFPVAVRRVALDPGHGGDNTGTHAPLGLIEKELTLEIAGRLERRLEREGFQVMMTRHSDQAVPLDRRAALANAAGADIFVSIHLNWIENRGSRGVETYYLGPTNDPYLTQLAAAENRDSGHSLADVRRLLDRIYAGVRQDNSRKLAESVQASLFRSLGRENPALEDRGVKAAPFIVLLDTEMPAILAEVSCLSNDEEARLLSKPLYRQSIAEALAAGIRVYADAVAGAPGAKGGEKGT